MNSARRLPKGYSVGTPLRGEVAAFVRVVLQMSTELRLLIGRSETFMPTEKRFLLSHWFDCINKPGSNPPRKAGAGPNLGPPLRVGGDVRIEWRRG